MKMRRLLRAVALASATLTVSSLANAADLGPPPPAPIPAYIPFSWTGFYIGGNAGVAWTQGDFTDSLGNTFGAVADSAAVFTGGGQVGANYQINYWLVVGLEADFDWMTGHNNNSNGVFIPALGSSFQLSASNDRWVTTLAARVGVPVERALFYVKGGGGWLGANELSLTNETTGASISGSNNTTSAWLVGAGVEYAFAPNWTAKVEYDFLGLSNTSFTVQTGVPGFPNGDVITTSNRDLQMVTVGFNYLFNWH
jgi:outer membrane immunogenic protein